jgi:hypothetical protein
MVLAELFFNGEIFSMLSDLKLEITDQGVRKVG